MAKNPIFPLYYNDIDRSTRDWTDEEFGCYVRLLLHQWDKFGLPLGFDRLSRISTSVEKNWPLISQKFEEVDGVLKNPRLEVIRAERIKDSDKQTLNGKKGGRPKKNNPKETQNKPKINPNNIPEINPKESLHNEYEYEVVFRVLEGIEDISNEVAKVLAMVVIEMMMVWMEKKPDYRVYRESDYHACYRIAQYIGKAKKFRMVDITGVKESEVLKSWKVIAEFISSHTFYTTLTLDSIASEKMFQKIENAMREQKNGKPGNNLPIEDGLAEARKNWKSFLPPSE